MNLILPNRRKFHGGHGAAGGDPNWSDVVLLCHCEGADEGTTFTDDSNSAHSLTAVGNANTEADQYKWGSTSAQGDGNGDKITAPDGTDFRVTSSTPYTIEMWVRLNSLAATNVMFGRSTGVSGWRATDGIHYLLFSASSTMYYQFWTTGTSPNTISGSISGKSANTWYHVAISFNGTTHELYFDGTRLGISNATLNNPGTSGYTVAFGGSGVFSHSFAGYIDDVRFTNGTGRYTGATITVPTGPFPDS